jgi:hypothetical protein
MEDAVFPADPVEQHLHRLGPKPTGEDPPVVRISSGMPLLAKGVEARGYHLSLVLAHQHMGQLPKEIREALGANARTKVVFAVSPEDAHFLERHFAPALSAHDLSHLAGFQAACRPCIGGGQGIAFTLRTEPLRPGTSKRAEDVRNSSARQFAVRREVVEEQIFQRQIQAKQRLVPQAADGARQSGGQPGAQPGGRREAYHERAPSAANRVPGITIWGGQSRPRHATVRRRKSASAQSLPYWICCATSQTGTEGFVLTSTSTRSSPLGSCSSFTSTPPDGPEHAWWHSMTGESSTGFSLTGGLDRIHSITFWANWVCISSPPSERWRSRRSALAGTAFAGWPRAATSLTWSR